MDETMWFLWGVIAVASGLVTQMVADRKGLSNGAWFVYGLLVPGVALIHVLLKPPATATAEAAAIAEGAMKPCPACAEPIRAAAVKCRYCGTEIVETSVG